MYMICGTVHSSIASQSCRAVSITAPMFFQPVLTTPNHVSSTRQRGLSSRFRPNATQACHGDWLERFFVRSLVEAGKCSQHARQYRTATGHTPCHHRGRKPTRHLLCPFVAVKIQQRQHSVNGAKSPFTRKELHGLVDYYSSSSREQSTTTSPNSLGVTHDVLKGSSYSPLNDTPEEPLDRTFPLTNSHKDTAITYNTIVDHLKHLLCDKSTDSNQLLKTWNQLPYPRASHVPEDVLHTLLHRLSVVEHNSEASMLRYMSVVEDVKASDIKLKRSEWTTALAFVGRCYKRITAMTVESALHMWKSMEEEAGVQSSNVTFNVLFDIASKAGKFVLSDMIIKEMENRNLEFNRYFRTNLIFHYGLRADGAGVRNAYREFVESGEIVDTVVLSCVILSLLKCGEAVAAEQVFERSKLLHAERTTSPFPPQHWLLDRDIGRILSRAAQQLRLVEDHEARQVARRKLEDAVSIAPNLPTYKGLISYHSVVTGNIDRVTELVDEMETWRIKFDGAIFLYLFKGFCAYGGLLYTSWTRRRLESTCKAYISAAMDPLIREVYFSRAIVSLALQAYAKCAGHERTLEIWEEIKTEWQPGEDDILYVQDLLEDLFQMGKFKTIYW